MADFLKSIDTWALILGVFVLSGWFVWSLRRMFTDLKGSIDKLSSLIEELFKADKDFERRLSHLEGEHKARIEC